MANPIPLIGQRREKLPWKFSRAREASMTWDECKAVHPCPAFMQSWEAFVANDASPDFRAWWQQATDDQKIRCAQILYLRECRAGFWG
jgi:hypothetical protein